MLRIAVVYNQPQVSPDHPLAPSEWEIVEIARLVVTELQIPGWQPELWEISPNNDWQEKFNKNTPDVVFNLFEGFYPEEGSEDLFPAFLESLEIRYTGNNSCTLRQCRNKQLTRELLKSRGLPVASGEILKSQDDLDILLQRGKNSWPLMVKPALVDASIGIEPSNVVENLSQLKERVSTLLDQYGPVLVEEFLPGREFNISVVELDSLQVLPVSEIVFRCVPEYPWPIVTYDAKWKVGSVADRCTQPVCPANIDTKLKTELEHLAEQAFRVMGCRHYARVDIRLDREGQPRILEVNPNPGYHPEAGFSRALQAAGWSHAEFSRALVRHAWCNAVPKN